jgi:hypothetical protein
MPITTDSLLMDISVDVKKSSVEVAGLSNSLEKLVKDLMETRKSAQQSSQSLTDLGATSLKLNATLDLLSKAYTLLIAPLQMSVKAFMREDEVTNKLAGTLRLLGQETQEHMQIFLDFAESMDVSSRVSGEVTLNLAAQAKAMGATTKQTLMLVQASADLASLMDKDIFGAFNQLTTLMNGVVPKSIEKLIPQIKTLSAEQLRAGKGVEMLAKALKGMAGRDVSSLTASIERVGNSIENFMKAIGRLVEEVFRLPSSFDTVKNAIDGARKVIESAGPSIKKTVDALAATDWGKIATGVLSVAAAFVALKSAMAITGAIAAVGGLSSAIALMGGMTVILAQITTFFAAMKTAALAAVIPMMKLAATVGVIMAVVAAVDILVRNFRQLDKLAKTVALSMEIAFNSALMNFKGFADAFMKGVEGIASSINKIAGRELIDMAGFAEMEKRRLDRAKDLADRTDKLISDLKDASKDIDFGFAGEGLKLVNRLLGDTTEKVKDVAKTAKTLPDVGRGTVASYEDMKKVLDELTSKNEDLLLDIANMGASTVEQIENALDLELERLAVKEDQLRIEGKLNGEMGKRIQEQIDLQKELIETQAATKIDQVIAPNAINPDQLEAIKRSFGEGASGFAAVIGKAMGGMSMVTSAVSAVMGAISGLISFVQELLDFVPKTLDAIANIFKTLTDLPGRILESVKNLGKEVVRLISDFIPNLLQALPDIVDSLAVALFEKIPEAISRLMEALPDIFDRFAQRIPELTERVVAGLVAGAPSIAIRLTNGLVRSGPRIAIAMMKVMAVELPKAIVEGIVEGVKQIFGLLSDFGSSLIDPEKIGAALSGIGKRLTGEASQLFAVMDLTSQGEAVKTAYEDFKQAINDATLQALNILKALWDELMRGLVAIWRFIYDTFIQPLLDGIRTVWLWVYDNVIRPILGIIQQAWQWVSDNIISPLSGAVQKAWQWVVDNVINRLTSSVKDAWEWVYTKIVEPLVSAFNRIFSFKFPEFPKFYWPSFPEFKWPSIPKPDWWKMPSMSGGSGSGGLISGTGTPLDYFNKGGFVKPIYAQTGLMIPKGTDSVPAMLTPGEFVVQRPAVQALGAGALHAINKGIAPVSNTTVNLSFDIKTTEPIDDNFFRQKIMPRVREEFRRASLDGSFVIAGSGIR